MSGKKVLGVVLLLIGASALLGLIGIHIGGIISLAIGVILIGYGIKQWRAGKQIWATILLTIGILVLIGSLPMVFTLLLGAALVYFGYKLLTNNSDSGPYDSPTEPPHPHTVLDDPFDAEWEQIMKSTK